MYDLKSDRKLLFFKCGRCKGDIRYLKREGRPDICPECGFGFFIHGSRSVHDIPGELRLNLNTMADEDAGSRGITEQKTITSR